MASFVEQATLRLNRTELQKTIQGIKRLDREMGSLNRTGMALARTLNSIQFRPMGLQKATRDIDALERRFRQLRATASRPITQRVNVVQTGNVPRVGAPVVGGGGRGMGGRAGFGHGIPGGAAGFALGGSVPQALAAYGGIVAATAAGRAALQRQAIEAGIAATFTDPRLRAIANEAAVEAAAHTTRTTQTRALQIGRDVVLGGVQDSVMTNAITQQLAQLEARFP
ncbi:hypothetical protein [Paracoccus methylarcula]|uniref:Uncharacterized protein n=1 Tax=Paracoccus methylarcula TaxID=72022 RepID=A0A3R7LKV8_9RHOB|nr:hypothetical protein [Paracoccus methylarcula]RNF35335.1 hypothetical protein A7A09_006995 [Paracoccus methylarcula]